ncbi:hypothetical protein ACU635_27055 [[Actinomadura] parvosata]|uniref:hypothetical protein n=1 Tax=[Actinomadura] parvosata TaxID=1955412 RepID=UPI00406C8DD2
MITFIIFALAAVCAAEALLGLALLGLAIAELTAFLRRHPDGAAGGLRELAAGARRVWPLLPGLAKGSSQTAGRRVLRSRPGRWVVRIGRAQAAGVHPGAAGRVRRTVPGSPPGRTPKPASGRPRCGRQDRVSG